MLNTTRFCEIPQCLALSLASFVGTLLDASWHINTAEQWEESLSEATNVQLLNGQAKSTQAKSVFASKVMSYPTLRTARSITFKQSATWANWIEVPNVGLPEMVNALILLTVKEGEYYILGRHAHYQPARKGKQGADPQRAPLDKSTRAAKGGYHAWYSSDMETWTHCGPVSTRKDGQWMTTAEYADGKFYLYYDSPNDQDPCVIVDDNLRDGIVGEIHRHVLKDPTDGSDCAVIRDVDGTFHLIYENWDYNNPQAHSWDSPVAGHAVSPDGVQPFKILDQFAVDERTTPTGEIGSYTHPSSKEPLTYQIHTPEQNAYGDWTAIKVGGQYYLFCDNDPVGGHIKIGCFTSDSLYNQFKFVGEFGRGHPDPSIGFAEGQFYLIQQQGKVDFISPGPWVKGVEARAGVDQDGDGAIDKWTSWQEVEERYALKPGFARVVDAAPAQLDLSMLPAGYGFAFEYRTSPVENQLVPVVMEQIELSLQ